ncbi:ABC transporter ATP-binding protein [Cucumibacter marinus]|uniref:ABC transporter ATP-binding protein n=1 Tax=Cucumibacter marinus TaxID=1121252 RepID=UPI00068517D4|nr:ABC transporter ATP-binding protein [Cucumibacter marinus]
MADEGHAQGAEPVIRVEGLTKSFGDKTVVDGFDMSVPRGAIYGFLGPNGSGKTTTIRMMCGLLTPNGGSGTCLGFDIVKQSRQIKERVGYMTQRFSLYEDLTIRENLDFMARMYRLDKRRQRVDAALEDLGLKDRSHQLAGQLSGGWKQRLALGAAMLHEPDLLLLDEPTAGVDPKARRDFWDEIHRLSDRGVTVLVSTHYMDEAVQCDYIAYIAYGKKLIDAPAAKIPEQVGLITYRVEGDHLVELSRELDGKPGVEQIARFGSALHISGMDETELEAAIAPYRNREGVTWQRQRAGLEEVFIHLMAQSFDNFAAPGAKPGESP